MSARAVFLDRDGTLIVDVGYPRDPARVSPLPGAIAALRALADDGWTLVVVSNQSGIARGIIAPAEAAAVAARFVDVFAAEGVHFAGVYYCPHGPDDGCACRKPAPGMLRDAARDHDLALAASWMVGDKQADVDAGVAAGCAGALRFTGDWPAILREIRVREKISRTC